MLILILTTLICCINATVYTFVHNDNDLLSSYNWSPQSSGFFTSNDDLILPVEGEFILSMPINVNSITVTKDVSINGDEITVNTIRNENNALLSFNGMLWMNGENYGNVKVNSLDGEVVNYGTLELSGCSTLKIENHGTVEVNDKNGNW